MPKRKSYPHKPSNATYQEYVARFWNKVDRGPPDQCWIWKGAQRDCGYGNFWYKAKNVQAHRFSYQIQYGDISNDLQVRHRCDTPVCVNPFHLELGTRSDNMTDIVKRCRSASVKLTAEQVLDIRKRVAGGAKKSALARQYGVVPQTIAKACNGSWKFLERARAAGFEVK